MSLLRRMLDGYRAQVIGPLNPASHHVAQIPSETPDVRGRDAVYQTGNDPTFETLKRAWRLQRDGKVWP
jgi:hypothetical protein